MSEIDILAALEATPRAGDRRCKLAAFLETIPEDQPGRAELVARTDDSIGFPALSLTLTFTALGHPIGVDTIRDHRGKRCMCFR